MIRLIPLRQSLKDPPGNTNLSFEAILSHEQIKMHKTFVDESGKAIWNFASLQMYAKLPPYTDVGRLAGQLRDYPSRSLANENVEIRMLPIGDVRYRLKDEAPFTLNFIRLFVVAGMLLLFSALFNFLNLHLDLFSSTHARVASEGCEWSCRADSFIGQMLFELTCAILLALLPACYLVVAVNPVFSGLLGISMEMPRVLGLLPSAE